VHSDYVHYVHYVHYVMRDIHVILFFDMKEWGWYQGWRNKKYDWIGTLNPKP
jgi:hypothetical protein